MNGGPVAIPVMKQSVPAIVEAFYPGELGGPALVNVLMGAAPVSGRLPYTIYTNDYIRGRNMTDASLTGGPGTTYMYYQGKWMSIHDQGWK
jgi:beta-glucosidase